MNRKTWILIEIRLIEARLNYLKARKTPVAVRLANGQMTDFEKAENFYRYVTETGLSFTPYEKLLNPRQIQLLPLVKSKVAQGICRGLFH